MSLVYPFFDDFGMVELFGFSIKRQDCNIVEDQPGWQLVARHHDQVPHAHVHAALSKKLFIGCPMAARPDESRWRPSRPLIKNVSLQ